MLAADLAFVKVYAQLLYLTLLWLTRSKSYLQNTPYLLVPCRVTYSNCVLNCLFGRSSTTITFNFGENSWKSWKDLESCFNNLMQSRKWLLVIHQNTLQHYFLILLDLKCSYNIVVTAMAMSWNYLHRSSTYYTQPAVCGRSDCLYAYPLDIFIYSYISVTFNSDSIAGVQG